MLTAGAVILDVYRRQRLRTVLATLGMVGHQTCEALVPVAFGLVIDRAVRTGDGGAMWLSSVGILLLFTALTFSARGGHWMATKAILEGVSPEGDAPGHGPTSGHPALEFDGVRAEGIAGLSLALTDGEVVGVVPSSAVAAGSLTALTARRSGRARAATP